MRTERGFTLLEVLVAFIIAALALGVLYSGTLGGIRAARLASHYAEALALAQSHVATLATDHGLKPREVQGDDDGGFLWHGRITPLGGITMRRSQNDVDEGTSAAHAALFAITVIVRWKTDGRQREVRLDTARMATVEEGS
jgi:general secretion pathway protein I